MNTQHLVCSFRELVAKMEYDRRMVRRSISSVWLPAIMRRNLSQVTSEVVVVPIVNELCRAGRSITFQFGISTGFFYMMVDYRRFAVLYIPKPALGRIYIKFLNEKGAQCMPSGLLNDTDQITDYLNKFNRLI